MINNYYCICCQYQAKQKSNYERHLKTIKHIKESTKSQPLVNKKSTFSQQKVNLFYDSEKKKIFCCKYCDKRFTTKQAMYKHIKYTCKKNNDEDIKELVRLLNEQNELKDKELLEMKEKNEKQIEIMKKQIEKLSNKLQIQQINSNNNIVNFNNIQLLNYNDTDYSHISNKTYYKCVKNCFHSVKSLIKEVHFNNKKPENKNIYISNIKNKYIMVYKDNKWQLVNRKEQLDDLYNYNEVMLEEWFDEYKDKYPDMIKSFTKYLNNRDNDMVINKLKEEIILMMYNNRHMIENINNTELKKIVVDNNL